MKTDSFYKKTQLLVDKSLFYFPFESLDIFNDEQVFCFRLLHLGWNYNVNKNSEQTELLNLPEKVCYLLNPDNDLLETEKRLRPKLTEQIFWKGMIGSNSQTISIVKALKEGYSYMLN